jgi:diguanylate cyclase (GGDEF)-like protein
MDRVFSMKRLICAVVVVLGWASSAWAAPAPLTTLAAIQQLDNEQASKGLPVVLEATVTYFRGYERTLFVQDGDRAIYVLASPDYKLSPGDRVLIHGVTGGSFHPIVMSSSITVLGHAALPQPEPASYEELLHAQHDSKLVTVRAKVLTADMVFSSEAHTVVMEVLSDGGLIKVGVDSDNPALVKDMLDAEVEITGAASGQFDGKMQQTGVLLHVASFAGIQVIQRAQADPWSLPVAPMDEILASMHSNGVLQRIRVHGSITYYQPGSAVVLQNGSKSLWIMTQTIAPLRVGDVADATGFPDVHDGFLALAHSEVQDSLKLEPVPPVPTSWKELATSKHLFDLVSIEGQVVMVVHEATQDEYVLVSDGHLFSAIYRHPPLSGAVQAPLPDLRQIPLGSKVNITGVCILEGSNPFDKDVPFNILLRSIDDVAVVAEPSWLSIRNLVRVVSLLFLLVVAVSLWGATLNRKVRRQTAALDARRESEAALERHMALLEVRRSRILEDINGDRPLAEILEQIAELVSFNLEGTPCWCEVNGGARLGNYPADARTRRIVREEIPARSGSALGALFAGFDPHSTPGAHESEALAVGSRLATLAIETRRLYSDLLHRSEFDLLTDIHNRFSLDKHFEALIVDARQDASVFGLIYIDLDEFKQVNDVYGHKIGDLYLQEATLRMKGQLRAHDLLARLGGDEFAVLVGVVHSRAEVEEIAQRLHHCFDEPFVLDGHVLHGSASLGSALYPEDGATRDSLLSTADAAMYQAKNARKKTAAKPDTRRDD